MKKMYNKVFISYAKEDFEIAKKLFDYLFFNGYDPWLDKVYLLPGQDWSIEIKKTLRKSDFIILLLSNISISKRDFVQREFKLACDFCEEKLDSDIYIIPLKIDDCEVPEKFMKYQWAELSNSKSFQSILNSLNFQRKKDYKEINILGKMSDDDIDKFENEPAYKRILKKDNEQNKNKAESKMSSYTLSANINSIPLMDRDNPYFGIAD